MFIASLVALAVVAVVVVVVAIMYDRAHEAERQRKATRRRIQGAERDIAEIGRATRAAIMEEVQRQLRQGNR